MNNFQINSEKGRKEWFARLGAGIPSGSANSVYGTGCDVTSTDTLTYVLQQRMYPAVLDTLANQAYGPTEGVLAKLQEVEVLVFHFYNTAGTNPVLQRLSVQATPLADACSVGPVSPAHVVELVRKAFSLNVSDAAEVFRVSRPTIYQWAKLDAMDQIRSSQDRERLKKLYEITTVWTAGPKLRGRWYVQPLASGKTILDLLKAENLDSEEFSRFHTQLEQQSSLLQGLEHMRAKGAVVNLRQAMSAMEMARPKGKGKEDI